MFFLTGIGNDRGRGGGVFLSSHEKKTREGDTKGSFGRGLNVL